MGILSLLIHAIAFLFVGALAFILIDIAGEFSPEGTVVDTTTDDVRTGLGFLHRPLNENTFAYGLVSLLGLLLLYGLYSLYSRGRSGSDAA